MPQVRNAGSETFEKTDLVGIWLPGMGSGRLGRFRGAGSLLYHHSDQARNPRATLTFTMLHCPACDSSNDLLTCF
jgi:hypothetical protein